LPFDPSALEARDEDKSIFVGGLGALWQRLTGSKSATPKARGAE
jgi:hypothetical protein